jgi:hypothetical protein
MEIVIWRNGRDELERPRQTWRDLTGPAKRYVLFRREGWNAQKCGMAVGKDQTEETACCWLKNL